MSHIIGRGRYARETYPQPPKGNGGVVCLLPLFRTIYVDGNTTTDPADQNGTISCPYDGIQKALDTIPPLSVIDPLGDAEQGFVLMIAPGYYDEEITMPLIGRMIILRATGGLSRPSFAPIGTPSGLGPLEGPPVRIEGGPTAGILMDYSFLTEVSPETSICPYYQFEGLFVQRMIVDAGSVDSESGILSGCISSYRDCWIIDLFDEKNDTKYSGQFDFRDTFVGILDAGEAGVVSERSQVGDMLIGRVQGADSVFDSIDQFSIGFPDLESSVMLHDCEVTTFYSSLGGANPLKHDGVTEYLTSLVGSSSSFSERRIQDLVGNGYWKLTKITFGISGGTMLPDESAALLTNPNASSRTYTLPGLTQVGNGLDYSHPSATGGIGNTAQMTRVIMVKNSDDSDPLGDIVLNPSSGTTIGGSPTRILPPGEALILIGDGASNNWEIMAG